MSILDMAVDVVQRRYRGGENRATAVAKTGEGQRLRVVWEGLWVDDSDVITHWHIWGIPYRQLYRLSEVITSTTKRYPSQRDESTQDHNEGGRGIEPSHHQNTPPENILPRSKQEISLLDPVSNLQVKSGITAG